MSTFLSASIPVSKGKAWYAAGRNSESSTPTSLTITVWCLPADRIGSVATIQVIAGIDGTGTSGTYATCPVGYRVVTGGAIWQIAGDPPSPSIAATTVLSGSSPTLQGDGWWASGKKEGFSGAQLRVVALCRPKAAVGTLSTVAQNITSANAASGLYVSCPTGQRVLSIGAYPHAPGQGPDLEQAQLTVLRSLSPTTDGKGAYVAAWAIHDELALVVQCRPRI